MTRRRWIALAFAACLAVWGVYAATPWLLDTEGFVPRAECGGGWTPALLLQQESGHTVIFLVYQAIAATILCGLRLIPRKYHLSAILWAAFIASCGWTHATNRVMFRVPAYHLDVAVLDVCVVLSIAAWLDLIRNVLAWMATRIRT